jgi:hypothetical protein
MATFYRGKIYAIILTKRGLGYILGEFFANSSGHPDMYTRNFIWSQQSGRKCLEGQAPGHRGGQLRHSSCQQPHLHYLSGQ